MIYSKLIAVASALPETVLTNVDLEKLVDTNDEWIRTRTGIRERRIVAPGVKTSDIAFEASQKVLSKAGLKATDIDLIILATISPDHFCMPSTACELQQRLGANGIPAFDIVAACSGFIYGLKIADAMIRSGSYRRILLVGAETLSYITDWTDRGTCILFSDGAGAAIIEASETPGIEKCIIHADGQYADMLMTPRYGFESPLHAREQAGSIGFIQMRGNELFKLAVKSMADVVVELLELSGTSADQVDLVIPHQANIRIIDAVAKRLGLPIEKVAVTVEKYGNNSAGTIPIALEHAFDTGRLVAGQKVVLTAFGGGLTWGGALITV
ncbi:beta-ketoacyl-ACP synthase III [Chrysiogenes arsenatis]|uniref:beta-ketoacyl-ACP synthase III n=1 Tax=Chrysiogenes arsenatis TaxID=309797 RepID=UPI000418352D|nr:beta-ketoacyl-ACP synthase III [Chrysiogenes arsenatis]